MVGNWELGIEYTSCWFSDIQTKLVGYQLDGRKASMEPVSPRTFYLYEGYANPATSLFPCNLPRYHVARTKDGTDYV